MGIIDLLVRTKWRMVIGYGYVSSLAIGIVIAKNLQDVLKNGGISVPFLMLYFSGLIGLMILGYIIDKAGIYSKEVNYQSNRNPFLVDISKNVKK